MADNVRFEDYSVQVMGEISQRLQNFVEEASFEIESRVSRDTPTDKPQLKSSWARVISSDKLSATVGSPLEQALWNEYGTGSHAQAKHGGTGRGRQGWWVYVKDQPRSSRNSKVYESKEDAEKGAAFLRSKGLDAYATNGEEAHFTLYNAFQNRKEALINRAQQIMREGD